jgi:DUF4097 and DUF4098 domain-containing protein YvlB
MRKVVLLTVGILLNMSFIMAFANGQKKEPFMSQRFPMSSVKSVEVTTSGGDIAMNSNSGSEAVVEVYISKDKWSDEKIKQMFEKNYIIDIKVKDGKLHAEAKPKNEKFNWKQQGLNISFKIIVPREVSSNLITSGGDIEICDLSGTQNLTTSGGDIVAENCNGKIHLVTSGGDINVSNLTEDINASTSGGDITAKDCNGKIHLATSGGNIKMDNIDGNTNAATSAGNLTANNINGNIRVGTSGSGNVILNNISGSIYAKTSGGGGSIKLDGKSIGKKINGEIVAEIP